ncbi:hypothetical protein H4S08_003310, partial [Coemansia sp. RSA 1365]
TLGTCIASLLGIAQVCIQGCMFYITFVLYMTFFPEQNKYESEDEGVSEEGADGERESEEDGTAAGWTSEARSLLRRSGGQRRATVEWQTALWVMGAVVTHASICMVMSVLLVTVVGPYAGPTRTWASLLGLFSLCLTCMQFLPQISKTWRSGVVGALSIPMMLMQTPGGFLFAYSIAVRPGVNWSSWISTFMAATLQGVLLSICLVFDAREKREHAAMGAVGQRSGETGEPADQPLGE